ncbi:MFS transporter [Bacillus gobiensis]|uniref:MFS transporter n=2 Tax=Bacillus gobiensis TaxID=1441095 RepID=UPI003D1C9797
MTIAGIARLVPKIEGHASASFKKSLSLFSNGTVISALFLSLFWIMGYYAVYTYLTPFLINNVYMDTTMISVVLLILGVFSMIGSRFGGYSSDCFGTTRTLVLCLLIHALSLICLPLLIGSLMSTVIGLVIWMCAAWMTGPSTQTYFVQEVPESSELALSLNTSVLQLGSALGAGFGGVVVNSTASTAHNPLIGGCVVILGLVTALVSFSIRSKVAVESR